MMKLFMYIQIETVVIFREVFEIVHLIGYDLSVDKFNLKYYTCGQSRLREILLKQGNFIPVATMAANTQTEEQVSLKLLVNKDTDKVLFVESGKDFIDVLCSFLTLPLGTIARLVDKESGMGPIKVGCLGSLYHSVARLDVNCLRTATCKEMLLQPRNSSEDFCKCLKLNIDDTEPREYLMCKNLAECKYLLLSTFKNQVCDCGNVLDRSVFVENDKSCNGFVKNGPTFIVTDELIVLPNSLDTSFGLL